MNNIDRTKHISERMALSVIGRYAPQQVLWHYEHGLVLQSIYALGISLDDQEYKPGQKKCMIPSSMKTVRLTLTRKTNITLTKSIPVSLLFELYKDTGDKKYRIAIETLREQLRNHPRTESAGFWHKKNISMANVA